jgi:hypothetical protein
MVEQASLGMSTSQSHLEGERNELFIFRFRHGPTNNHAREEIQDDCEVQPPFRCRDSGRISDPPGIGTQRRKIPLQHIGGETSRRIAPGRRWFGLPTPLGLQPQGLHQPHHALASTTYSACLQGGVNTWTPIDSRDSLEKSFEFRQKAWHLLAGER